MSENGEMEVLLVEDSEADAVLTSLTLSESSVKYNVLWVADGEKALQALNREGDYVNAKRPDVIFLDLNIPKVNGHDVLRKIKTNSSLKPIPVFVLTDSNDDSDVERTFLGWADNYIVKPIDLEKFESVLEQLRSSRRNLQFNQS